MSWNNNPCTCSDARTNVKVTFPQFRFLWLPVHLITNRVQSLSSCLPKTLFWPLFSRILKKSLWRLRDHGFTDGVFADVPNSPEQEPDSPISLHTVPGTMGWGQIQVRPAIGYIGRALGFSTPGELLLDFVILEYSHVGLSYKSVKISSGRNKLRIWCL